MRKILSKKVRASAVALALLASIFSAPTAQALYKVIPATQWGNIYAGEASNAQPETRGKTTNAIAKSKFDVKYNNFPDWAKKEVQAAVDVWAANFSSPVTISVDASLAGIVSDKLWIGGMYRLNSSAGGFVQYQISRQFRLGVGADFGTNGLRNANSGSYELLISYDFNYKKSDVKSPRYF